MKVRQSKKEINKYMEVRQSTSQWKQKYVEVNQSGSYLCLKLTSHQSHPVTIVTEVIQSQ